MKTEEVSFFVDGDRVAATLYRPDRDGVVPAVVYCQGFGGTREYVAPDLGPRLAANGFALLAFDHRGFGGSGGRRNRIMPHEQIEDVRAAAWYLATRDDIDADAVGLLGVSFGGAIAIAAAAAEPVVRATVACVPFSDGSAWMREIRRYWEWVEFCERLERDRRSELVSGVSEEVDPDEILVRDPESVEWNVWLKDHYPSRTGFKLSLASARALLEFRPLDVADRVRGLLMITVDHDTLTPREHAEALFERAAEPKRLHVVRNATHHGIYRLPAIDEVAAVVTEWLSQHLHEGSR